MQLDLVQKFMTEQRIDGWLLYDFRGNNPVLAQLLPGKRWTTRRAMVFIPARWHEDARRKHAQASELVAHIKDEAFALIGGRIAKNDAVDELQVQRFILDRFAAAGLATAEAPIVAVNAHAGDPHFEVSASNP